MTSRHDLSSLYNAYSKASEKENHASLANGIYPQKLMNMTIYPKLLDHDSIHGSSHIFLTRPVHCEAM